MREIMLRLYLHHLLGEPAPVMVFGEPVPAFTAPSKRS